MPQNYRHYSEPTLREPIRVITPRIPKSLHESLKAEAHERGVSLNRLCIAKLGEPLAHALSVPTEQSDDAVE